MQRRRTRLCVRRLCVWCGSVLQDRDRALGAGAGSVAGVLDLVGRDVDDLAPGGHVALVVLLEQVLGEGVAAAVAAAEVGVELELHADTSHETGRLSSAIIAPPPLSISGVSDAIRKSGTTASHSSTATFITIRARCAPRQRCGPPAKPRWLLALRSSTNSCARSYTRGSRLAPETRP